MTDFIPCPACKGEANMHNHPFEDESIRNREHALAERIFADVIAEEMTGTRVQSQIGQKDWDDRVSVIARRAKRCAAIYYRTKTAKEE